MRQDSLVVAFGVGDRVVAQQNKRRLTPGAGVGQQPRHGVIEEVLRGEPNPRYLIRWDLGEPSIFTPRELGLRAEDSFER